MRPVYLEDDVYERVAKLTLESGKSASACLRDMLGMTVPMATRDRATISHLPPSEVDSTITSLSPQHELSKVLEEATFRTSTTAVARMLRIFQAAHDLKPDSFSKVLSIKGRDRVYFARSRADIAKSGKHTQPHAIRGSDYWVMTNSPTPQKQAMVRDVLALLGFSAAAVNAATALVQ
jgi:negative modulator of initiation of replication